MTSSLVLRHSYKNRINLFFHIKPCRVCYFIILFIRVHLSSFYSTHWRVQTFSTLIWTIFSHLAYTEYNINMPTVAYTRTYTLSCTSSYIYTLAQMPALTVTRSSDYTPTVTHWHDYTLLQSLALAITHSYSHSLSRLHTFTFTLWHDYTLLQSLALTITHTHQNSTTAGNRTSILIVRI